MFVQSCCCRGAQLIWIVSWQGGCSDASADTRTVGFILVFAVIGLAVWFAYWAAFGLLGLFQLLQPAEKVTLLTAAFTIIGSTLAVMVGRSFEKQKELDALHRDKKIPIYDGFLTGLLTGFQDPESQFFSDPKFVDFLKTWHRRLTLWADRRWSRSMPPGCRCCARSRLTQR